MPLWISASNAALLMKWYSTPSLSWLFLARVVSWEHVRSNQQEHGVESKRRAWMCGSSHQSSASRIQHNSLETKSCFIQKPFKGHQVENMTNKHPLKTAVFRSPLCREQFGQSLKTQFYTTLQQPVRAQSVCCGSPSVTTTPDFSTVSVKLIYSHFCVFIRAVVCGAHLQSSWLQKLTVVATQLTVVPWKFH